MIYKNPDTLRAMSLLMNDQQIGDRFGITRVAVRHWRQKFDIPPSPIRGIGSTKYQFDRSFFASIDSPEKAYILGFIIADGSIHRNGKSISIAIKEEDVGLLSHIRSSIGSQSPITAKHCTKGYGDHTLSVLNICGVELVKDLTSLGVFHDKTTTATYPPIPRELESHLVRGLIDGDGSITKRYFVLIGTGALISGVRNAVYQHTGCLLTQRTVNGHWRITGNRRDRSALVWIFKGATLALDRKRQVYQQFWD